MSEDGHPSWGFGYTKRLRCMEKKNIEKERLASIKGEKIISIRDGGIESKSASKLDIVKLIDAIEALSERIDAIEEELEFIRNR